MLSGTPAQAEEGLRRYREWSLQRAERIAAGAVPRYRIGTAESFEGTEEAASISVQTVRLPSMQGARSASDSAAWCIVSCNTPSPRTRSRALQ